jgi:hypothetical protein
MRAKAAHELPPIACSVRDSGARMGLAQRMPCGREAR